MPERERKQKPAPKERAGRRGDERAHREGREAQGGHRRPPRRDRHRPRGQRRGLRPQLHPEGRPVTPLVSA